jgi:hypothetical protein
MKPSPSKPTVSKAMTAIVGIILAAKSKSWRARHLDEHVAVDTNSKENVAPILIDARHSVSLRHVRVFSAFFRKELRAKVRNERETMNVGKKLLERICFVNARLISRAL